MSKQDTRLQIIDTAIDLFWKTSYHATNMNDLSRVAGVNKATVYQHFGSKEELAIAAVERAADRTIDYVFKGAFEADKDPLDRLRGIYRRIYESHLALYQQENLLRGCPMVNIGVELSTTNDQVREAVREAFKRFALYYKQIIEDLRVDGTLRASGTTDELAGDLQDNMNACLVTSKLNQNADVILKAGERAARYITT
ncbi:MAG: TetR/AcrR family transcriptional regulator [Sneathiella sp.]